MNFLIFLLSFTVSAALQAQSFWVLGNNSVSFFAPGSPIKVLSGISTPRSLVDKSSNYLWVESQKELVALDSELNTVFRIPSPESLLGDFSFNEGFFTFSENHWTFRSPTGMPLKTLKAPVSHPQDLVGIPGTGFWTLNFQSTEKKLELVHWNLEGEIIWSRTISENTDVWGTPQLFWDRHKNRLWVGYSITTAHHAYSPVVEQWSCGGQLIQQKIFSERGLFLDGCLLKNGEFVVGRDIPSLPYTAPLFSFLELFDSSFNSKTIYQGPQNQLIRSLYCSERGIWSLESSLFGGTPTQLTQISSPGEEVILLSQEDPAWKIQPSALQ